MHISNEWLAIGANSSGDAAAYGPDGRLAYASGNCIAVAQPDGKIETLKGHASRVNVVSWMGDILVSGSQDCTVRIWNGKDSVLEHHHHSVISLAVHRYEDGYILVTASMDGTIIVYKCTDAAVHQLQQFQTQKYVALAVALIQLPSSTSLLLALGGSSKDILIYTFSKDEFLLQTALKGHEDWVRSLDFRREENTLLLASAGQDRYIRIWKISAQRNPVQDTKGIVDRVMLSNKMYHIKADDLMFYATFEALLVGHDDWVTSCRWHPSKTVLASASADTSLMFWEPESASGVWVSTTRLGEISEAKGGTTATGSPGGFWHVAWQSDGIQMMCTSRTGAIRVWRNVEDRWQQVPGIAGHTKEVTALSWDTKGRYLFSTGMDQTSRLWAQHTGSGSWMEFSRPQIHGYDINAICAMDETRFASGADEKVVRIFQQPASVARILHDMCGVEVPLASLPQGADVPLLGLSNKSALADGEDSIRHGIGALDQPPLEDHLQRHSLWPEVEKLYGHGYEIAAIACSHDAKILATACKATTIEHGVIRLYDTETWKQLRPSLKAHSLTIQRLAFSFDDKYLLSVGRDRQWSVFKRQPGTGDSPYGLQQAFPKAHSRIIWDACWLPQAVEHAFVTVSRDKKAKIWQKREQWSCRAVITLDAGITAVDALPFLHEGKLVLAIGLEDSSIVVYTAPEPDLDGWTEVANLDQRISPAGPITQLSWQPCAGALRLAVASEDTSVRVYSIV